MQGFSLLDAETGLAFGHALALELRVDGGGFVYIYRISIYRSIHLSIYPSIHLSIYLILFYLILSYLIYLSIAIYNLML